MRERFKWLAAFDAHEYKCTFCGKITHAYYPPEWGYERIACIECYQRELQ